MLPFVLLLSAAIAIDAGELDRDLAAMLRAEIGDAAFDSAEGVRVVMKRGDFAYFIEVFSTDGSMGERELPVSDGPDAALRLATLLAVRALDASRGLEDPLEIPPGPDEMKVYGSAGFFTAWWQRPSTPTLGFGVGVGADFDTFTAGVLVIELGRACCSRASGPINAEAQELLLLADGSFSALRWGPLSLRARVSGGMNYVRADTSARVTGAAVRKISDVEGVFRAGGSVDVELAETRVWLSLGTGAWFRAGAVRVVNIDNASVFSGNVVPYVEALISARIF